MMGSSTVHALCSHCRSIEIPSTALPQSVVVGDGTSSELVISIRKGLLIAVMNWLGSLGFRTVLAVGAFASTPSMAKRTVCGPCVRRRGRWGGGWGLTAVSCLGYQSALREIGMPSYAAPGGKGERCHTPGPSHSYQIPSTSSLPVSWI